MVFSEPEYFTEIQDLAGYSFWLMHKFGSDWRGVDFYAEKFLTAFPTLLPENASRPIDTGIDEIINIARLESPEIFANASPRKREATPPIDFDSNSARVFKMVYAIRTLTSTMGYLGLVKFNRGDERDPLLVRKSTLFEQLLRVDV